MAEKKVERCQGLRPGSEMSDVGGMCGAVSLFAGSCFECLSKEMKAGCSGIGLGKTAADKPGLVLMKLQPAARKLV